MLLPRIPSSQELLECLITLICEQKKLLLEKKFKNTAIKENKEVLTRMQNFLRL